VAIVGAMETTTAAQAALQRALAIIAVAVM
jgi:hypothetical protein